MAQQIVQISLLVKDYDDAIAFYIKKLNFELVEDTQLTPDKRWVVVAPKGNGGCNLLLAKASNDAQINCVGNQTGGRVFLFLNTDNIEADYANLLQLNVTIVKEPSTAPYGKVLVFADLYGNLWDLIEPTKTA